MFLQQHSLSLKNDYNFVHPQVKKSVEVLCSNLVYPFFWFIDAVSFHLSSHAFVIPRIYHPTHLSSHAFVIPRIYHPTHLSSHAFVIPRICYPTHLSSHVFVIPRICHPTTNIWNPRFNVSSEGLRQRETDKMN